MVRVSVPDDYEKGHILLSGTEDYHYPEADVQVDADRARTLQVREDEDGRYVGPVPDHVDAVRAFLGVTTNGSTDGGTSDAELESVTEDDPDICGAELSAGGTCERPADECPYHGDEA